MPRQTFEQYFASVSSMIFTMCGMTAEDIDDYDYYGAYDDKVSVTVCARRAVRNAMDACGL